MRRNTVNVAVIGVSSIAMSFVFKVDPKSPLQVAYADKRGLIQTPVAVSNREKSYTIAKSGDILVCTSSYDRVDEEMLDTPRFKNFAKGHALHESLRGDKKVEKWEIYRKKGADEILAVIKFGEALNGHPGIVHGGIISLLFDDCFGWVFFCLNKPMSVTANLDINFRKPLRQNTTTILRAKMTREEGRKMYMDATLHEASDDGNETLLADSSTLFIEVKLPFWKQLYMKLFS